MFLNLQEHGSKQVHPFEAHSLACTSLAGGLCLRGAERVSEHDVIRVEQKEIHGQEAFCQASHRIYGGRQL